jgi:hypothetical protein
MKYIEIKITIKDDDYQKDQEIYRQSKPMEYVQQWNRDMIEKIVAVVNNLPFPINFNEINIDD